MPHLSYQYPALTDVGETLSAGGKVWRRCVEVSLCDQGECMSPPHNLAVDSSLCRGPVWFSSYGVLLRYLPGMQYLGTVVCESCHKEERVVDRQAKQDIDTEPFDSSAQRHMNHLSLGD